MLAGGLEDVADPSMLFLSTKHVDGVDEEVGRGRGRGHKKRKELVCKYIYIYKNIYFVLFGCLRRAYNVLVLSDRLRA